MKTEASKRISGSNLLRWERMSCTPSCPSLWPLCPRSASSCIGPQTLLKWRICTLLSFFFCFCFQITGPSHCGRIECFSFRLNLFCHLRIKVPQRVQVWVWREPGREGVVEREVIDEGDRQRDRETERQLLAHAPEQVHQSFNLIFSFVVGHIWGRHLKQMIWMPKWSKEIHLLLLGSMPKDFTSNPPHPCQFLMDGCGAKLVGLVFSGLFIAIWEGTLSKLWDVQIVLGNVKNEKVRSPVLLPNWPTQHEAGWEEPYVSE